MRTIKKGMSGTDVQELQTLLIQRGYAIANDGIFGRDTENAVREFQKANGLSPDGIVGKQTWEKLKGESDEMAALRLTEADISHTAELLDVEVPTVKAVLDVETGNKGGFLEVDKPTILFEGHIFWKQLKSYGIDPAQHQQGNEDILYPQWTTRHYKGGLQEYDRLMRARAIHPEAADASASWGLAQIMGFNCKACGCKDVAEFVSVMKENEGKQLELFARFIQHNKWDVYLRDHNWKEFARRYNGPSYDKNQYDVKLEKAYLKHKG